MVVPQFEIFHAENAGIAEPALRKKTTSLPGCRFYMYKDKKIGYLFLSIVQIVMFVMTF